MSSTEEFKHIRILDVVKIVTIINRPELVKMVEKHLGRTPSLEEIDNLENTIESAIEGLTENLNFAEANWVEEGLSNSHITA